MSDGTLTTSKTSKVTFIDVNESPVIATSNELTILENNKVVTTIAASDPENDTIEYSLGGPNDGDSGSFTIDSSSGELAFKNAPDYETKTSYSVYVSVTDPDGSGGFDTKVISISVLNTNDNAPSFTSSLTFTIEENQTAIGTVTATDLDGDNVSFSISGSDISVNSTSGVLSFNENADYETASSYTENLTASDGENQTTETVTVN